MNLPLSPAFDNADQWLRVARRALREGDHDCAAEAVFEAARDPRTTPDLTLRTGRMRAKISDAIGADSRSDTIGVRLYAQCTVDALVDALPAVAWREQILLEAEAAPFDSVLASLEAAATKPGLGDTNVNVFFPWNTRLFAPSELSLDQRIDEELAFWQYAWDITNAQTDTRIVQVGYDTEFVGPLGVYLGRRSGHRHAVAALNERLLENLPDNAYFVDLQAVAAEIGNERFYDPRRDHLAKQPFSDRGAVAIAEHVWAGIRALVTGPKKILVTDLDNTLWGGVVGEVGGTGIALGDTAEGRPFLAYQTYLKGLAARGCVLAICSKNNPDDGREPFTGNDRMLLSLDDFAAVEIGWDPKPVALKRIAKELRLGLEHFVFVDDHPAERHAVRAALPQVAVPELPEDPSEYVRTIERGLWFEAIETSAEDTHRAAMYRDESKRRESSRRFASAEEYLAGLELKGTVTPVGEERFDRVVQLIGKTNQFNLTTRRHTAPRVRAIMEEPRSLHLTVSIRDRYGDYGLVVVVLGTAADADPTSMEIDTWLMSCRVIGRTVEQFTYRCLCREALARGYQRLRGIYVPTAKNELVRGLYPSLGFEPTSEQADGTVVFETPIPSRAAIETAVSETD